MAKIKCNNVSIYIILSPSASQIVRKRNRKRFSMNGWCNKRENDVSAVTSMNWPSHAQYHFFCFLWMIEHNCAALHVLRLAVLIKLMLDCDMIKELFIFLCAKKKSDANASQCQPMRPHWRKSEYYSMSMRRSSREKETDRRGQTCVNSLLYPLWYAV